MVKTIAFESADRLGKSTQVRRLVERIHECLFEESVAVVIAPDPDEGHSVSYKIIRAMLKNGTALRFPRLFQFLHFANRMKYQCLVLPHVFASNDIVIFDRWALSLYVYGLATGVDETLIKIWYDRMFKPEWTVILEGLPHHKDQLDSYEANDELQRSVRQLYRLSDERGVIHIDVTGLTEDEVHERICYELTKKDVL